MFKPCGEGKTSVDFEKDVSVLLKNSSQAIVGRRSELNSSLKVPIFSLDIPRAYNNYLYT
jgi:hypothetical protein